MDPRYLWPGGENDAAPLVDGHRIAVPFACTIRHLYVVQNLPSPNFTGMHYTLLVNGVASALSAFLFAIATSGADLVNSVVVAQGDLLSLRVTKDVVTSPPVKDVNVSVELA